MARNQATRYRSRRVMGSDVNFVCDADFRLRHREGKTELRHRTDNREAYLHAISPFSVTPEGRIVRTSR